MTTTAVDQSCRWCGSNHTGKCPTVKAVEYFPDGTVKRVEFLTPGDYAAQGLHVQVGPYHPLVTT